MKASLFGGFVLTALVLAQSTPVIFAQAGEVNRQIAATEWDATEDFPGGPPFIQKEMVDDTWVLSVNAETPEFCFGWLKGPEITVPAVNNDSLQGNTCGLRVHYSFTTDLPGTATPELRIRLNTSDFGQYSTSGVAKNRLDQLQSVGEGVCVVEFDRTLIDGDTTFIPYIDLMSFAMVPGSTSPLWKVTIEEVEFFTKVSNSSFARADLFNLVYKERDNDIYAYVGSENSRQRIHVGGSDDVVSLAYDGAFCIVLDDRSLYAYTPLSDLERVQIKDGSVISAALSDHHVIFVESDGDVKYYNIITGEDRTLAEKTDNDGCYASGDGTLGVFELDGGIIDRLYRYDTRDPNAELTRVDDDGDVWTIRERSTGIDGS